MALPESNISLLKVACLIGEVRSGKLDTRLSSLCRSEKVNKYSRFRPGYWSEGTDGILKFNRPAGGGYNDPRGEYEGISTQVYRLGDFRLYNHSAVGPSTSGQNPLMSLWPSDAPSTIQETITVELGEVDWFGKETRYWGKNTISGGYNQVFAVDVETGNILGYSSSDALEFDSSGYRCRTTITLSLFVSDIKKTYNVAFGIGYANKMRQQFPDVSMTIITQKISHPTYVIKSTTEARRVLYNLLKNLLSSNDTDIYDIVILPYSGSFESGLAQLNFTTTDFGVIAYPTYDKYRIIGARVTAGYKVTVTDSSGATIGSWTGERTWATAGTGKFNVQIPLSVRSQDGYKYEIEITSLTGITNISKLPAGSDFNT